MIVIHFQLNLMYIKLGKKSLQRAQKNIDFNQDEFRTECDELKVYPLKIREGVLQ